MRVLSDTEFINEFKRSKSNPFWQTIQSIQTTIKTKLGLGKPFTFTFNAPCYKRDSVSGNVVQCYDGEIEFDFKQFGINNDTLLMQHSPVAYCLKVCHKIGFYLMKIHDKQLLRMKVEFYQDDHGRIWLFNCLDIWIRTIRKDTFLLKAAQHATAIESINANASQKMNENSGG